MTRALLGTLAMVACSAPPSAQTATAAAVSEPEVVVRGVVVDASGAPVAGARVALVDQGASEIRDRDSADARGRFELGGDPGATYGVTATAPGHAGGFRCGLERSGEPAVITLALGRGGDALSGTVRSGDLEPIAGLDLTIGRVSEDRCGLFAARTDARGRYAVRVPRGESYTVEVGGGWRGKEWTRSAGDLTIDLVVFPAPAPGPAPAEVGEWIKANAVALTTSEPGSGTADLDGLREVVGDARIVGFGEATHGTREFFQLKHRALELLVSELGFTAFVIEGAMPQAFAINDYVLGGDGDPREALSGMHFWVWNTEEVLALIEWMRAYNAGESHRPKIRFYGNDVQFSATAAAEVMAYLERVDRGYARSVRAKLAPVADDFLAWRFRSLGDARQRQAGSAIAAVGARLERHRIAYTRASSEARFERARQHARVLAQFVALNTAPSEEMFNVRDQAMADNTSWVLERQGPGGKVMVWAHNGHVQHADFDRNVPMGAVLRRRYGARYRSVGFSFLRGGFQAVDVDADPPVLRVFELGPAPIGSFDRAWSVAGPLALIDLRRLPAEGPVATWMNEARGTRWVGSDFAASESADWVDTVPVHLRYDAVIHVDKTTAARPNHDRATVRRDRSKALANPDLDAVSGGRPTGWRTGRWIERSGYRLAVESGVVEIARDGERRYGRWPGTVSQRLDGRPYAGKTIRVSFRARGRGSDPVYVFVEVRGAERALRYARVGPRFERHELEIAVPAGAAWIELGLSVTGDSTGWLDRVAVANGPPAQ